MRIKCIRTELQTVLMTQVVLVHNLQLFLDTLAVVRTTETTQLLHCQMTQHDVLLQQNAPKLRHNNMVHVLYHCQCDNFGAKN